MPNLPPVLRLSLFILIVFALGIGFTYLPRQLASQAFVYLLIALLVFAVLSRLLKHHIRQVIRYIAGFIDYLDPVLKHYSLSETTSYQFRRLHLLEIGLVFCVSLFVTQHYLVFTPDMRVAGQETEWLTGGGQVAYQGLRDTGTIPLWNSSYRQGEPIVDNAFSFILNPFASFPHLLFGSTHGTKLTVVIHALVVAVGGWFLGWVLGLSTIGRLTLAFLLLGKGNMNLNFEAGYIQLAMQQAYFPWVIAGTIACFRLAQRWAICLTAMSLMLMLFAGNLWHLLPMVISIGVLVLLHSRVNGRFRIDVIRRMIIAGFITIGLCAIVLLSLVANFALIEDHPDEIRAGWEMVEPQHAYLLPFIAAREFASDDLSFLIRARHDENEITQTTLLPHQGLHFYYSYVSPWWYVILIILPLPFLRAYRQSLPDNQLIWIAGLGLYTLFTMWGMGGTALFVWLYEHVPYLAQWRFVPRAFGMASFWIALLVAMRIDSQMRLWMMHYHDHRLKLDDGFKRVVRLSMIAVIFYLGTTVGVWGDVAGRWTDTPLIVMDSGLNRCLSWLRDTVPHRDRSIWILGYERITYVLENNLRIANIEADYQLGTPQNTIGHPQLDIRQRFTPYRLRNRVNQDALFAADGYTPMLDSPAYRGFDHCLYTNNEYQLPYAFVVDVAQADTIDFDQQIYNPDLTNQYLARLQILPASGYVRLYDTIALQVQSNGLSQPLLVIQELAYPGWIVSVDGDNQDIEIFGKLNAVKLPLDNQVHQVIFMYRPLLLYIGAWITIITSLLCIGYLLRIDQRMQQSRH